MSVLKGKRIVITRPRHKAHEFAQQLRWMGAEPIILPLIAIRPLVDPNEFDAKLYRLESYDWLILTSSNTVQQLQARFEALNFFPRLPQIAVIGTSTARTLRKYGLLPNLVPNEHIAEALFEALMENEDLAGKRIFLPQGDLARPTLAELLRGAGAEVDTVVAYETVRPEIDPELLKTPFDVITFTSSSAVNNFMVSFDNPVEVIGDAYIACIGPVTAETAHAAGLPVHIVASTYSVTGLTESLIACFEDEART